MSCPVIKKIIKPINTQFLYVFDTFSLSKLLYQINNVTYLCAAERRSFGPSKRKSDFKLLIKKKEDPLVFTLR